MLETELQDWRQQIHDLFHETQMQLKDIVMELDQLMELNGMPARQLDQPQLPSQSVRKHEREPFDPRPATAASGNDFSLRLDHLKRKLNERLQERLPQSDASALAAGDNLLHRPDDLPAEKL